MRNEPTYAELWERVQRADDMACEGLYPPSCGFCEAVLDILRGSTYCEECGHINALGHDCAHWICDHDAGVPCKVSDVPWIEHAPSATTLFGSFGPSPTFNDARITWVPA